MAADPRATRVAARIGRLYHDRSGRRRHFVLAFRFTQRRTLRARRTAMSATALFGSISRIARHEVSARPIASVGKVTGIHPNEAAPADHAVSVQLRDSGIILN